MNPLTIHALFLSYYDPWIKVSLPYLLNEHAQLLSFHRCQLGDLVSSAVIFALLIYWLLWDRYHCACQDVSWANIQHRLPGLGCSSTSHLPIKLSSQIMVWLLLFRYLSHQGQSELDHENLPFTSTHSTFNSPNNHCKAVLHKVKYTFIKRVLTWLLLQTNISGL